MDTISVWADRIARRQHAPADIAAARAYYIDQISRRWPRGPAQVVQEFAIETPWLTAGQVQRWMRDPPVPLLRWVSDRMISWTKPARSGVGLACFGYGQSTGPCTSGVLRGAGNVGQNEGIACAGVDFHKALQAELYKRGYTKLRQDGIWDGCCQSALMKEIGGPMITTDQVKSFLGKTCTTGYITPGNILGPGAPTTITIPSCGDGSDQKTTPGTTPPGTTPPVEQTDIDLVEKVCMREMTRFRGPSVTATTAATDAVNAAQAAQMAAAIEADGCGAKGRLFDKATGAGGVVDWRLIACFGHKFAKLPADERQKVIGIIQAGGLGCLQLATSYSSLYSSALSSCPAAVSGDLAYASRAALVAASWNPYDPNAGPKWQPSVTPGPPGTPPPQLPGGLPNWACNPFPGCLLDANNWPQGVPHVCEPFPGCVCDWMHQSFPAIPCPSDTPPAPGTTPPPPTGVNWGCTPFPQCLADPANWPQGVNYPCQPWPTCVPQYVAALYRSGNQPGTEPPPAEAEKPPWYKTGWGMAAIGAGAVVVVGGVVLVAAR